MTQSSTLAGPAAPATTPSTVGAGARLWLWVPRLLVAVIFVYAGLGKVADPAKFAKEIRNYNMAPVEWTNLLAAAIPAVELTAAGLLVLGLWRREARILLSLMLIGFTAAKSLMLLKGIDIECGCVPPDSKLAFLFKGATGIATNVVLIFCLLVEGYFSPRRSSVPPV